MPSLMNVFKNIIISPALIVKSETDVTNRFAGLSGGGGSGGDKNDNVDNGILDQETRIDRGSVNIVVKTANYSIMDQAQPAVIKDADYVVDIILPTILIALLFVGNAVIIYIISQYRKRNVDNNFRKTPIETRGEEIVLSATRNGDPQV